MGVGVVSRGCCFDVEGMNAQLWTLWFSCWSHANFIVPFASSETAVQQQIKFMMSVWWETVRILRAIHLATHVFGVECYVCVSVMWNGVKEESTELAWD